MTATFNPERLLKVLARHGVEFVLIGGLAAVAHGSPLPTTHVDVTPNRDPANLNRLAAALREHRRALPYLRALLDETGG